MFVLVDHEDRENEGDLVIPPQFCGLLNAIKLYGHTWRGLNLPAQD